MAVFFVFSYGGKYEINQRELKKSEDLQNDFKAF
jgi:hypothetical protein